ncbi:hypothetical protein AB9P05_10935 [Roseivirga sp. BDSF3-8]|uniref:hypothetical protein n=1 Tax=Roseivirga sp. BDSF3-8 TaxID=3241598 RepID=UPI003531C495
MGIIIGVIVILLPIILIAAGYYKDYKRNPAYFKSGIKVILILMGLFVISSLAYKIMDNTGSLRKPGPEYNSWRAEKGIPLIEGGWGKRVLREDSHIKYFAPEGEEGVGHYAKEIILTGFGEEREVDYFGRDSLGNEYRSIYTYDEDRLEFIIGDSVYSREVFYKVVNRTESR